MEKSNSLDAKVRSRRDFFANAAAVLATAGVVSKLEAQTTGGGDLDILNFALRLERLEAAFYTQGLAKFSATDFANAAFAKPLSTAQLGNVYGYFQAIQQQEMTHVAQISGIIQQAGGTAVPQDCYAFSLYGPDLTTLKTVDSFVAVAMVLENTGVMAYDGAIALVTSPALRTAAATIATVEARHAAYLNELNGVSPFPAAFDTAATATDILTAASKFIANCSIFPPTAVAGPKGATTSAQGFRLDATKSTIAGGGPVSSYLWEAVLGTNAKLSDPHSATPTVTFNMGPGIYTFVLLVMDAAGNNSTDTVKINYTGA
jgi:rubrerythrin